MSVEVHRRALLVEEASLERKLASVYLLYVTTAIFLMRLPLMWFLPLYSCISKPF
jgi:hypothetical protein